MSRVFALLGATLGSAIGWWLGGHVGVMTAFLLSMVGTGIGIYGGTRTARYYTG